MDSFTITVTVTAEDIAAGLPGEARHCPIALALARALTEQKIAYSSCAVYETDALVGVGRGLAFRAFLPDDAKSFIRAFDETGTVQPINFELTFELY